MKTSVKEKKNAVYSPAPGEFWLIPGDFRQEEPTPHRIGYYGLPSFFTGAKMLDGEAPEQDCFYRVVHCAIQSALDRCAFTVTVQDFTRGTVPAWINQLSQVKILASQQGGKLTESHTPNSDLYQFVFGEFCDEFFTKIDKIVNGDCCYESIYISYSGFELNACDPADIKKGATPPSIHFWMDEEHPVLIVQMDFAYPSYLALRVELAEPLAATHWESGL